MFKNVKTKIAGIALTAAAAANAAAPGWAAGNASADSVTGLFDSVLEYAAPIGIAVVVGVAGVRVVIKLINRGAGK